MKRTPDGTPVGVDDPLDVVDRCDWITQDGRCRLAITRPERDPDFAARRRREDYRCPYVDGDTPWAACDHFRSRDHGRRCVRCGLDARPNALDADARPLLEEHHLTYEAADGVEITVTVCRWCHAKIHAGDARLDDDAQPDRAALAERERRRRREREESFTTAAERRDGDDRD